MRVVVVHRGLFLSMLTAFCVGVWWLGYQMCKWALLLCYYPCKWMIVLTYLAYKYAGIGLYRAYQVGQEKWAARSV